MPGSSITSYHWLSLKVSCLPGTLQALPKPVSSNTGILISVCVEDNAEVVCCGQAWISPNLVPGTEVSGPGPVLRTSSFLQQLKTSVRNAVRLKKNKLNWKYI